MNFFKLSFFFFAMILCILPLFQKSPYLRQKSRPYLSDRNDLRTHMLFALYILMVMIPIPLLWFLFASLHITTHNTFHDIGCTIGQIRDDVAIQLLGLSLNPSSVYTVTNVQSRALNKCLHNVHIFPCSPRCGDVTRHRGRENTALVTFPVKNPGHSTAPRVCVSYRFRFCGRRGRSK